MPYLYLILCLLLVACGGEGFSVETRVSGDATLDLTTGGAVGAAGGADSSDPDGGSASAAATTGGTQSGAGAGSGAGNSAGGAHANPTGGSAGTGGTEPDWIPDAECGPPVVDYSQLPTHFIWESYEATSGDLCMYCLESPCVEFEAVWDETFMVWNPWEEGWPVGYPGGGELQLRTSSTTRLNGTGDTIKLGRSDTCGSTTDPTFTSCNCSASFGDSSNATTNMFMVRSATGWVPDHSVFHGMAPESCSPGCVADTLEEQTLRDDAAATLANTLTAESSDIEFPCAGN